MKFVEGKMPIPFRKTFWNFSCNIQNYSIIQIIQKQKCFPDVKLNFLEVRSQCHFESKFENFTVFFQRQRKVLGFEGLYEKNKTFR